MSPSRAITKGWLDEKRNSVLGRQMEVYFRVHGVEAEPGPIGHQDAARFVLLHRLKRIARIFFPVDEVSRGSHRGAPEVLFGARLGTAVVVSVIAAFVLDDLVQGNEVLVIITRAGS